MILHSSMAWLAVAVQGGGTSGEGVDRNKGWKRWRFCRMGGVACSGKVGLVADVTAVVAVWFELGKWDGGINVSRGDSCAATY